MFKFRFASCICSPISRARTAGSTYYVLRTVSDSNYIYPLYLFVVLAGCWWGLTRVPDCKSYWVGHPHTGYCPLQTQAPTEIELKRHFSPLSSPALLESCFEPSYLSFSPSQRGGGSRGVEIQILLKKHPFPPYAQKRPV